MAMSMPTGGGNADEPEINSAINTTPLVDVMLVLLIIFLITIPVVTHTIPVALPHETNVPTQTKPQNIIVAVDADGQIYWNDALLPDFSALLTRFKARATEVPQPEVHIRADKAARYEYVGKVVFTAQRAGMQKIAFVTEPDHGSAVAQ